VEGREEQTEGRNNKGETKTAARGLEIPSSKFFAFFETHPVSLPQKGRVGRASPPTTPSPHNNEEKGRGNKKRGGGGRTSTNPFHLFAPSLLLSPQEKEFPKGGNAWRELGTPTSHAGYHDKNQHQRSPQKF
jgi:lipoprotein-anchoring transpeptidase ErfK/SrfK